MLEGHPVTSPPTNSPTPLVTSRTLLVNSRTVEFGRLADVPVTSPTYLVNLLFELESFQTVHMVFTPAELTTRSVSSDLRRI